VIHPITASCGKHRSTLAALLRQLKLPDLDGGVVSSPEAEAGQRSSAARAAANARWSRRWWRVGLLAAPVRSADSEFSEIIGWYQDLLERTYPPADLAWEPVRIGPTWQYDDGWSLPDFIWAGGCWRVWVWLRDKRGKPWQFTPEQTRFFCGSSPWDGSGGFLFHSAVLQR